MNNVIEQMLDKYKIKNTNDEINALKEIIQEIVLSGLSRSNFFDEIAFYGGTALRIFYKLDRFSEDLDFALVNPNKDFDLSNGNTVMYSGTMQLNGVSEDFYVKVKLNYKNK